MANLLVRSKPEVVQNGVVGKERALPSQSGGIPVGDAHGWSVLSSELLENVLRLPRTSRQIPSSRFPIVDGKTSI